LLVQADKVPEIVFSLRFKVKVVFGLKVTKPNFPSLTVEVTFSGVTIVPFEKNVRPVKALSPFNKTEAFSSCPETVISPINDFDSVPARAIIEVVVKIIIAKQAAVMLRSQFI
jgi:hypothetical protein